MPKPWEQFQSTAPKKPWEQFQGSEAPKPMPTSPAMSALYGASQGATFGFADEGIARAKALLDKVRGRGDWDELVKKREYEERKNIAQAEKDNPKTYAGANLAGTFASNLIPGVGIARGTGLGMAALKAGAQGALTGAGTSESSITEDPAQVAEEAAKGGAIGGTLGGIFGGLGKAIGKFTPEALRETAEQRAVKAATGQNVGALRKAAKTSAQDAGSAERAQANIQRMGRDILDEGALEAFDSVKDLAPKLGAAKQRYGSQIGEIGQTIDRVAPNAVDTKKIANDLLEYAATIPETEAGKKLQQKVLAEAENFQKMSGMGFGQAQQFKNQFKYKPMDQDALISNQDVTNNIQRIIGREMDDAAARVAKSGPEDVKNLLDQYQTAKQKYGSFKGSSSAATDRAIKDLSNRFVSPSDYAIGLGTAVPGVMSGHPGAAMSGLAAAMANKFARERGSSTAAVLADKTADLLDKSPTFAKEFGQTVLEAMQRGPAALTTTHYLLMKNPKYRQEFEQGDKIPTEEN